MIYFLKIVSFRLLEVKKKYINKTNLVFTPSSDKTQYLLQRIKMDGENWPKFNGTGNHFYVIDKSDI